MEYSMMVLIALGIVLLIWILTQAVKRYNERLNEKMQQAGFFEVKQPDPALTERIRALYKRDSDDVTIGRVYHRQAGSYEMFVLHPHPADGSGPALLVRCHHLDLPRVIFNSKIPLSGKLGTLLNKLSEHVIGHKLPRVDLTMHPDLAAHYQVFSDNPSRALSLITPQFSRLLLDSQHLFAISGEGDLFGISLRTRDLKTANRQQLAEHAHLTLLVDEAGRVVEQLTHGRRQTARSF